MYDFGIDKSEFEPSLDGNYINNLLYYGEGKLTDTYYLRNVYLRKGDTFTNEGEHTLYILGEATAGTYLTTCPIKGVAFPTTDKVTAFAVATSSSHKPYDKPVDMVFKINAKFLQDESNA